MHDIKHLEAQWLRYQKNKRKPYWMALAFFVGLFLAIFIYINSEKWSHLFSAKSKNPIAQKIKKKSNSFPNVATSAPSVPMPDKGKELEKLKPTIVLGQSELEKNDKHKEKMPVLPVIKDIPILEDNKRVLSQKQQHKKAHKKLKIVTSDKPKVVRKTHLNIIESSSPQAYQDVENRFKKSHDVDDSLFLASNYYKKGAYKKAVYWALQTNKIDQNIEESWIILAKSKIKQGQTNRAIGILMQYIHQSNSLKAQKLLDTLTQK